MLTILEDSKWPNPLIIVDEEEEKGESKNSMGKGSKWNIVKNLIDDGTDHLSVHGKDLTPGQPEIIQLTWY